MMAVMAPWMVAKLVVGSVSRVVFLTRQSWVKLIYDFFALISFGFVFMGVESEFIHALMRLSLINLLLYVVYFGLLLWISGANFDSWGRN